MDTHINFLFILQSETPGDLLKLLKGRWDFDPDPLDFNLLKVFVCICDAFILPLCVCGAHAVSNSASTGHLLIREERVT